jgi:hypothetical protein
MTHGRHRQTSPGTARLLMAAHVLVMTAAVIGGSAVALLADDSRVLRLALCLMSWLAGLVAVLAWRRDRRLSRLRAIEVSRWRREQALSDVRLRAELQDQFDRQLAAVQQTLALVCLQLQQMRAEAAELRQEISALRTAKAAAEDSLRRLTAVPAYPSFGAAADQRVAFAPVEREAWISTQVSALFDDDSGLLTDYLSMSPTTKNIEPSTAIMSATRQPGSRSTSA